MTTSVLRIAMFRNEVAACFREAKTKTAYLRSETLPQRMSELRGARHAAACFCFPAPTSGIGRMRCDAVRVQRRGMARQRLRDEVPRGTFAEGVVYLFGNDRQ
jgi:hypothetical protein